MKKLAVVLSIIICICGVIVCSSCQSSQKNRTTYDIKAEFMGDTITATQTVDFYNDTQTVIEGLKFNLFASAYRKDAKYSPISTQNLSQAYYNGLSYGDITIEKTLASGKEVQFSIVGEDKNILLIPVQEVFPEERVVVKIDFTVKIANVISRTGYNQSTVNLGNFYPILCVMDQAGFYECVYYSNGDPFYSECADYTVSFTCDSEYIVAASGKRISAIEQGDKTTHNYKINSARSFALVLSKQFESITDNSLGVEINYYYYDDETPLKSMEYTIKAMDYFTKTFGEYPYSTYSVVQTKFVQGGMEYPALVMISDLLENEAYGEVIVHETAHQWWQTAVGNNEIEYGFLDEGLAEYSVIAFYENHPEYNLTREYMVRTAEQTYKVFCTVSDKVFGKVNTVMLRSLKDFSSEYEYVNIAYIKPCIMYDNLRTTIGEQRFFSALKKYYAEYKFKNATPDDLVGCFERVGAGTNGFFDSFFNGKVII